MDSTAQKLPIALLTVFWLLLLYFLFSSPGSVNLLSTATVEAAGETNWTFVIIKFEAASTPPSSSNYTGLHLSWLSSLLQQIQPSKRPIKVGVSRYFTSVNSQAHDKSYTDPSLVKLPCSKGSNPPPSLFHAPAKTNNHTHTTTPNLARPKFYSLFVSLVPLFVSPFDITLGSFVSFFFCSCLTLFHFFLFFPRKRC